MLDADDDFDRFLRQSLAERPEARSDTDFAARVLSTAGVRPRLAVWPVLVAAVAVVGVLLVGVMRVLAIEASATAMFTSSAASATNEVAALLPAGGVGLLLALAWLTARSAFALRPDEPYAGV